MKTLVELLERRADRTGLQRGYRFMAGGESVTESLAYSDLLGRAVFAAEQLRDMGVGAGTPIVLAYESGIDFLVAFFAAILARGIAVPIPNPKGRRGESRLIKIIKDLEPCVVLCPPARREEIGACLRNSGLRSRAIALIAGSSSARWPASPSPHDTCVIQYSSGSTATPRGIVLSHNNILAQEAIIADRFGHDAESRILSWLPHFHDMGLIGGLLQPLFANAECLFMPPSAFLARPSRWPLGIAHHRATTSGGPNFAFALCAEKMTEVERQGLDLSSWRVAFNGSDHVLAETLDRFAKIFAPCGFERRAFLPCYGLAEACLMVSGGGARGDPKLVSHADTENGATGRVLVGCGPPAPNLRLEIVDPETRQAVPNGSTGEIWVSGPSIARSYWNNPNLSAQNFGARLDDGTSSLEFMRTGDIGFLTDGELFIVGRRDDLILVHGRNIWPDDIEAAAMFASPLAAAAFVDSGGLVLVKEIKRRTGEDDLAALARSIWAAVWESQEICLSRLVLIRAGALPRTTSGKISRRETRRLLINSSLPILHDTQAVPTNADFAAASGNAAILLDILSEICPRRTFDIEHALIEQGFDSIALFSLHTRLADTFGVELDLAFLFDNPTISTLLSVLSMAPRRQHDAVRSSSEWVTLTGSQRIIAYSEELFPGDPFYHIGFIVRFGKALSHERLRVALDQLIIRHEPLRSGLERTAEGLALRIGTAGPADLRIIKPQGPNAAQSLDSLANELIAAPFDLSTHHNIRFVYVEFHTGGAALLGVVHHLFCDGWGLGVLLRDLGALLSDGGAAALPLPTRYTVVNATAQRDEHLSTTREDVYWSREFKELPVPLSLPLDRPRPKVESRTGSAVVGRMEPESFVAFERVCVGIGATTFMGFAALTAALLHRWTGSDDFIIGTAASNRPLNGHDVLGCFVNFVPMRIRVVADERLCDLLARVRETARTALAHSHYPYDRLVQRLNPVRTTDRKPLFSVGLWHHTHPTAEAAFAAVGGTVEMIGTETSDLDLRIIATPRAGGSLDVTFEYKTELFHRESIAHLLDCWVRWARTFNAILETKLSELPHSSSLHDSHGDAAKVPDEIEVVIAANFVADGLGPAIEHWLRAFDTRLRLTIAPFDQIHQELANPASVTRANRNGFNLVCIDAESWHIGRDDKAVLALAQDAARLLPRLADNGPTTVVCLFPISKPALQNLGEAMFHILEDLVSNIPGMRVLRLSDVAKLYGVAQIRAPFVEDVGGVSFSTEFLAAAGTRIARFCTAVRDRRAKAIVLDCDGVLWDGICGEVGPTNVVVSVEHAALHTFLVEKQREGLLLCLCSKNNRADVEAVFATGLLGPLSLEMFAATEISWSDKANGVLRIAEELGLDLSTIIFVDDSPFECFGVEKRLPGVFTLEATSPEETLDSLKHLWVLDTVLVTDEDRFRSERIQSEKRRKEALSRLDDLEAFVESLAIVVDISALTTNDIERVAQLSRRTTQFTTSAIGWTAGSLSAFAQSEANIALTVRASDRFGDYGLVGAMMLSRNERELVLVAFFLSCRALGRRVEDAMMERVFTLARDNGCDCIVVDITSTVRNVLARAFFAKYCDAKDVETGKFSFPTESAGVSGDRAVAPLNLEAAGRPLARPRLPEAVEPVKHHTYRNIMRQFRTASAIIEAVTPEMKRRSSTDGMIEPRTEIERVVAGIWSVNLRIHPVGVTDNFFDLGGGSLQIISILHEIHDHFGVTLSIVDFIDGPTVATTVAMIQRRLSEGGGYVNGSPTAPQPTT
jgi:FkbH-like protein